MSSDTGDLVAQWQVPLRFVVHLPTYALARKKIHCSLSPRSDGIHTVEFEHGTTSGKRAIVVDGKDVMRKDWMFKLVGG